MKLVERALPSGVERELSINIEDRALSRGWMDQFALVTWEERALPVFTGDPKEGGIQSGFSRGTMVGVKNALPGLSWRSEALSGCRTLDISEKRPRNLDSRTLSLRTARLISSVALASFHLVKASSSSNMLTRVKRSPEGGVHLSESSLLGFRGGRGQGTETTSLAAGFSGEASIMGRGNSLSTSSAQLVMTSVLWRKKFSSLSIV